MNESEAREKPSLVAWADESGSVASIDPGVYIMAAVISDSEHADDLRDEMRPLLRRGEKKLHWRSDSDDRHDSVVSTIAGLPVDALVVVREGPDGDKSERRRRKCLEVLLPALVSYGCGHLLIESRGAKDDQRDRAMLDALRAQKRIAGLRIDHAPGPTDPMLWIADAVCGAVVAHRTGESRWWKVIESRVTIQHIDTRPDVTRAPGPVIRQDLPRLTSPATSMAGHAQL